jgi:uncharacterized membrane protein YbjE (DUF340 family)
VNLSRGRLSKAVWDISAQAGAARVVGLGWYSRMKG